MLKKLFYLLIVMIFIVLYSALIKVEAAENPLYDASYNNGNGIFYANGASIVIDEVKNEGIKETIII